MKLSDYVANFLVTIGCRDIFVLSGGASLHLIHSIEKNPSLTVFCPLHEQAAAMAADGYFPKALGNLHKKYSTPHTSLALHSLIAFVAAAFLPIKDLITFSVFTFCFCFIMVSLSAFRLRKDATTKILSLSSILICFYLISQTGISSILFGLVLLVIGLPVYVFFAPKTEFSEAKQFLSKEENVLKRRIEKENVFLARLLRHVKEKSRASRKVNKTKKKTLKSKLKKR